MSSSTAVHVIRRRRNRKQRRAVTQFHRQAWASFMLTTFALLVLLPIGVFLGGAAYAYAQEIATLPTPGETIDIRAVVGATRLYDRSGTTLIYAVQDPLGDSRTWTRLEELPPYVGQATLLVEDPDFLSAHSFDALRTILRLWRNWLAGPIEAEASLTGRLVRNAIVPHAEFVRLEDRSREIALTAEINRRYSPQQVLEWHLNTNDYGNEAYGIEGAARVYLGKSARDLTLDEAALLASIPTAPQFNPIDDEVAARGRQADTLRRMLVKGLITQAQYDLASRTITRILPDAGQTPQIAPDFALYARQQTETILNTLGLNGERLVSRGGLTITTTLDLDLYYQAECTLRAHLIQLSGGDRASVTALNNTPCQAAAYLGASPITSAPPDHGQLVILDVQTGEIQALIGDSIRPVYQPGVTLYPFVYFEGFRGSNQGIFYTPASMLLDIPRTYPGQIEGLIYQPANPDGVFHGVVSLREAAARGLLPPVIEIANAQGLSSIIRTAHILGITSLNDGVYHLSLLDRGGEVALLDVAYAYSVFASMGDMIGVTGETRGAGYRQLDPAAVLRIADAHGDVLWEYMPADSRRNIFSDFRELGYLVNSVLSDGEIRRVQYGRANPLNLDRPTAVVNGMTADNVDNWTVGYTPQRVIGVHLNREDAAALSLTGSALNGAALVWNALMQYTATRDNLPALTWARPDNIVELEICQRSGLLPNGICPTNREVFIRGITPTQPDTYWQAFEINIQTGLLATDSTPDTLVTVEPYFVPPDAALDWWKANRQPLPPTQYDAIYTVNDPFGQTAITAPENYTYVQGIVEVRGNVNPDNLQFYQLAYGKDLNPSEWIRIGEAQFSFAPGQPLGQWDTAGLDGFYTLELTAVTQSGTRSRAAVQVRIDNAAPIVNLTPTESGKIYRFPDDRIISLMADVTDNFVIQQVEFYHDGRLVATDSEYPYAYDYAITAPGVEYFRAEAVDAAGNRGASDEITVEVRR